MATTGKRISYDDLVEPGIVEKLRKEILDLKKVIDSLGGDKGANVQQFNKALSDTVEVTQDLIQIQKEEAKVLGRIAQLKLKGNDITDKERAELRELTEEKKRLNRESGTQARLNRAVSGSMNELSQRLAANKQAYRKLTAQQRANNKEGGKLLKTIQKQDAQIKKLDKTLGDNQRNVGNYTDAVGGLGGQFGILGMAMNQLKSGFRIIKLGFASMKAAIVSTVIGAIVIAIVALVQWFKNTAVGAETLRKVMVPVNAVFAVLTGILNEIGEALGKLFSGDWLGALNQITGSVSNLNSEYKRQLDLETQLANLHTISHKARVKDIIELQRLENEIAAQRLIANDDENYSIEQQVVAINKAKQATIDLTNIKIDAAARDVAAANVQHMQNMDSEADEIALSEAIKAHMALQMQRDNLLRSITRRSTTLNNKALAAEQAKIIGGVETVKMSEALKTEALETGLNERFIMQERHAENIDELNAETFEKEAERQQLQNELVIKGFADTFGQLSNIVERNTVEWQLLSVAQATLNAFLAASQALADWKTFDPIQKVAAAFATLGVGLGFVTQMKRIGFAEGTESVEGGIQGKDSVNALLMPHERVLTVDQNKPLLQMGVSNKDIPGLVAMGLQSNQDGLQSSHLLQLQLAEQIKLNEGIRNIDNVWMDKDGNRVMQNKTSKKTFVN